VFNRDIAFRPISKEGLDEILKLAKFLERLEFNDWKKSTSLLNDVEKIIKRYKSLLIICKIGKDSQSFQKYKNEKSWRELPKYLAKVYDQLDKLRSFEHREKELRIIAIFLQEKLPPGDFLKLEEIFNGYHYELERVRGRSV
jgi:ribosomal protein L36